MEPNSINSGSAVRKESPAPEAGIFRWKVHWRLLLLAVCCAAFWPPQAALAAATVDAGTGVTIPLADGQAVTVPNTTDYAIYAHGGGTVIGNGIAVSSNASNQNYLVYSTGAGSLVTLGTTSGGQASTITGGLSQIGVFMENSGLASLGAGTIISLSGNDAIGAAGISITNSVVPAELMGSGISIDISGGTRTADFAYIGLSLQNNAGATFTGLTLGGGSLNFGAHVDHGSTLTLFDSAITINGSHAGSSIYIWPISTTLIDGREVGLFADNGGAIIAYNTDIVVNSFRGVGVESLTQTGTRSRFELHGGTITATGNDSDGVYVVQALGSATGTIIRMTGNNAVGARVVGGASLFQGNAISITTTGSNTYADREADDSTANLAGSAILGTGLNNRGVQMGRINPTFTMSGGTMTTTADSIHILSDASNAVLNFTDGVVVTQGSGRLLEALGIGTGTLNAYNGANLTGNIVVTTQNNVAVNLDTGALWTGAASGVGAMTMNGGSAWTMSGNSDVLSLSNANSAVLFTPPSGGAYKTLTVRGDYAGSNGLVGLNTSLGGNSSPTDMLVVQGGTSGDSLLRVANTDGPGALTSGEGIKVVDVAGTSAGHFSLSGRAAAGLYEYSLHQGAADGDWYLSSHLDTPDGPIPDIRPEVPMVTALVPLAREYGYLMLDSLHKRVGETRTVPGGEQTNTGNRPFSGSWGRLIGSRGFHKAGGNIMDNGVDYNYSVGGIQAGLDVYARKGEDGSTDKIGFYVGYGRIVSDVGGIRARSSGLDRSGKSGSIDMDAYSLGVYWTHLSSLSGSGWYSDAVAQGTYYHAETESKGDERDSTDGTGLLASVEGGYSFDLGKGIALEPQAQLVWQQIFMRDMEDGYGKFSFEDQSSLRGRAGLRLVKTWDTGSGETPRTLSTWARGNVWNEFLGESKTNVYGPSGPRHAAFNAPTRGAWGEAEAGVSGRISENVRLFTTGAYQHSLDGSRREGWDGRVGVAFEW